MITRLTTSASNQQILTQLQIAGRNLADIQNQLTTGRRINKMSESPASRAAIATQINAIRDGLISDANAERLGRPLFGGTTAGPAAYDAAGTYLGDNGAVNVPVSTNTTLQVNQTGPTVFGTFNAADPTSGDVFQLMSSLTTSVASGDLTAMSAGLAKIDAASARIATAQVTVGARVNQLDGIKAANDGAKLSLKTSISDIEDVDLADSLVALKTREAGYQAALQATSRVVQLSLMDFLK